MCSALANTVVTSRTSSHSSKRDFFPFPLTPKVSSQLLIEWKNGTAKNFTGPKVEDISCIGRHFGPRVYLKGSLVITLVVSVCVCLSVFKYLRDRSLVFSNVLREVRVP